MRSAFLLVAASVGVLTSLAGLSAAEPETVIPAACHAVTSSGQPIRVIVHLSKPEVVFQNCDGADGQGKEEKEDKHCLFKKHHKRAPVPQAPAPMIGSVLVPVSAMAPVLPAAPAAPCSNPSPNAP